MKVDYLLRNAKGKASAQADANALAEPELCDYANAQRRLCRGKGSRKRWGAVK